MFQDVYGWAGQLRSVNIQKDASVFLPIQMAHTAAETTFGWLHDSDLLSTHPIDDESFIEQISTLLEMINYMHLFREGNGRTQRAFLDQIATISGRSLSWRNISQREHLEASISAFDQGNGAPFHPIFTKLLEPPVADRFLFDDSSVYRTISPVTYAPNDSPRSNRGKSSNE
ncbi:hypothetical protein GCM10027416_14470 [Okibacterium endophyticum]